MLETIQRFFRQLFMPMFTLAYNIGATILRWFGFNVQQQQQGAVNHEVERLREENQRLMAQNPLQQEKINELQARLQNVNRHNFALRQEKDELQREYFYSLNNSDELTQLLHARDTHIEKLNRELNQEGQRRQYAENRVGELEKYLDQPLINIVENDSEHRQEVARDSQQSLQLQQQIEELTESLHEAQQEKDALQRDLEMARGNASFAEQIKDESDNSASSANNHNAWPVSGTGHFMIPSSTSASAARGPVYSTRGFYRPLVQRGVNSSAALTADSSPIASQMFSTFYNVQVQGNPIAQRNASGLSQQAVHNMTDVQVNWIINTLQSQDDPSAWYHRCLDEIQQKRLCLRFTQEQRSKLCRALIACNVIEESGAVNQPQNNSVIVPHQQQYAPLIGSNRFFGSNMMILLTMNPNMQHVFADQQEPINATQNIETAPVTSWTMRMVRLFALPAAMFGFAMLVNDPDTRWAIGEAARDLATATTRTQEPTAEIALLFRRIPGIFGGAHKNEITAALGGGHSSPS